MTTMPSEDDLSFDDPNFTVFASPFDDQSEWISSTPSINPPRPRTRAAGYDPTEQVLTVVFRDGTWWSYYGVSPDVWNAFKATNSPGIFLRTYDIDGKTLDTWDNMGAVNFSGLTPQLRTYIKKQAVGGSWQQYKKVYKGRGTRLRT